MTFTLPVTPPFAGAALLAFFASRAIPGVEIVDGGAYVRTLRAGGARGWVRVDVTTTNLSVRVSPALAPARAEVAARVRRLFDAAADIGAIERRLARAGLRAHVGRHPGLRVPGAADGFEIGARAVLGQQISIAGARTLAGRLAARFGDAADDPPRFARVVDECAIPGGRGARTPGWRYFPTAERLAGARVDEIRSIGMPQSRARTLQALARAVAGGEIDLSPGADPRAVVEAMQLVPGIGPWTANYVAMRALGWSDAFLAGDLGVRKAMGGVSARDAEAIAKRWRPYRAYAVIHLWSSPVDGDGTPRSTHPSAASTSSRANRSKRP